MEYLSGYGLCKKKFEPPVVLLLQMHRRPYSVEKGKAGRVYQNFMNIL
jgi:hypothetical protein